MLAAVAGLVAVAQYDNGAGAPASVGPEWPDASGLARDASRPTLIMVAHPRCTCTRASLTELAEIMARAKGQLRAYVVFARPAGLAGNPEFTELWDRASRIPGVELVRDDEGREAAAFGAVTSGQVYVYGPDGTLLFSGGTTRSRGHAGDNPGRRAILALVTHQQRAGTTAAVFGCALHGPADAPFSRDDGDHAHAHR